MEFDKNTIEQGTFIIALVGVLITVGTILYNQIFQKRVRLKVKPMHATPVGNAPKEICFSIDVINYSLFPVVISEIGVFYRKTKQRGSMNPIFADNKSLPRTLNPRESFTAFGGNPSLEGYEIKTAFAKTQCGSIRQGSGPVLKFFNKRKCL